MKSNKIVLPYKKSFDYSYASGAYAVMELLKSRPESVRAVYIHPDYISKSGLEEMCAKLSVPVFHGAVAFSRVNRKENSYVLGVFEKYSCALSEDGPHIVLVNPSDMGNLGTVTRTIAGFGIRDLAIITPAADIFDPKTVRASMGAVFRIRFGMFSSFERYREEYPSHRLYTFMLDADAGLKPDIRPKTERYALVFGNEATGLDERFSKLGINVRIPQSALVDSLNLAVAVGIGAYVFTRGYSGDER